MKPTEIFYKYKHKKSILLNPISDEQQLLINDLVDRIGLSRIDLDPSDPRAIPYLRPALWLWK